MKVLLLKLSCLMIISRKWLLLLACYRRYTYLLRSPLSQHFTSQAPFPQMHISTSIIASMLQNASSAIGPSTTQIGKTPETHVGTTTSWVAMITSPPIDPKCSHNFYSPDRELHTLIAFDPRLNAVANFTCLPREAAEWYSQKNLPFGATNGTVTSLGPIVCPGAYTTASTSQKDDISTMVYCCPSEYGFANPADHGMMYGCTAQQPLPITVHFPANPTASVERREASLPSKAMNIAGVAIIGWVFRPSLMSTPSLPSATSNSSPQANQGSGITLNGVFGIVFGILGAMILIFLFYFFHEWAKTHTRSAANHQTTRKDATIQVMARQKIVQSWRVRWSLLRQPTSDWNI